MPRPAWLTVGLLTIALPLACEKPVPPPSATQPATRPTPATTPASQPAVAEKPPADVLSVVRSDDPAYPTRFPLDVPADIVDAAKIVLARPALIDGDGILWLTHPKGLPLAEALTRPAIDYTIVTREKVTSVVHSSDGGPACGIVDRFFIVSPTTRPAANEAQRFSGPTELFRLATPAHDDVPRYLCNGDGRISDADFDRAVRIPGATVVPSNGSVLVIKNDYSVTRVNLPASEGVSVNGTPSLAVSGDGVWAWIPWGDAPGSRAIFVDAVGGHPPESDSGWPDKPVAVVPFADGSVLVASFEQSFNEYLQSRTGHTGPPTLSLKIISAKEKAVSVDRLRQIEVTAAKLADPDPLVREQTQRQLEAEGPSVFPILESLREQLPPEAQVRIETLLGQRFAPTLGGLRPLPGKVTTLARFPGGGCVLRFEGGGMVEDNGTPRSVIPATVLIRPGRFIELFDPASFCDFVPGRNSIQWVGGELLIGDPKKGLLRVIGQTARPLLPPAYADFDTVQAIDARRRWLLTSTKRPGETLLIDPSLPDTTPKLPTWTLAANVVGHTDDGYVALKRGDRLFVLDRNGWRVEKPDRLRVDTLHLPAVFDRDGRLFATTDDGIELTDLDGGHATADLPNASEATLLVTNQGLLAYTPDGKVRRYAIGRGPTLKLEATFTQGVPRDADAIWLDPAGRLVMTTRTGVTVGFPEGRIPGRLKDLMMNVER